MDSSATFQTIPARRVYRSDAATDETIMDRIGISGRGDSTVIQYDADLGRYTFEDSESYTTGYADGTFQTFPGGSVEISESDRVAGREHFNTYEVETSASSDRVEIYGNAKEGAAAAGLPIDLSYMSFAYWEHTNKENNETRQHFLLFGEPTAPSNMPVSGTARYKTSVFANMLGVTRSDNFGVLQDMNGSATFRVNFDTGRVRTVLDLQGASDLLPYGSYDGTGRIYAASNQFSGTYTSDRYDFVNGAFMGGFYGPSAQEMGYAFYIHLHDNGLGGASWRPAIDRWIEGAVIGSK